MRPASSTSASQTQHLPLGLTIVSAQVLQTTCPHTNGASSFFPFFFFFAGGSSASPFVFVSSEAGTAGLREERRMEEEALEISLVHEGQVGVVLFGVG